MTVVTSTIELEISPELAFAVSQTTGNVRLRWDPFIRRQYFLRGATAPGRGVQTLTVHRWGMRMVSEYVSFAPPRNVGMKMVRGPRIFSNFAAGWRFEESERGTRATWKYSFRCQPRWLAPLAERIGAWILQRDIDRRIAGFARGCSDPVVLEATGLNHGSPRSSSA